jgi:hypothetical protein
LRVDARRALVEPEHARLSIARQCELLGLARSSYYYRAATESPENLRLMRLIDEQYTKRPFYGVEKMTTWLRQDKGELVNPKRVRRLMRLMGIEAIYPKPRLSQGNAEHRIYPNTLAVDFCLTALEDALQIGRPEITTFDKFADVETSYPPESISKTHPNLTFAEILARTVAVRKQARQELIVLTDSTQLNPQPLPPYAQISFFKPELGKSAEAVELVRKYYKPVHQERVNRGVVKSWMYFNVRYPGGMNQEYGQIALSSYSRSKPATAKARRTRSTTATPARE